jgi:hypothetical protein
MRGQLATTHHLSKVAIWKRNQRQDYAAHYHSKCCMETEKRKSNISGTNTRDAVEISSLPDGQISCQYLRLPKGFDLKNKSKP